MGQVQHNILLTQDLDEKKKDSENPLEKNLMARETLLYEPQNALYAKNNGLESYEQAGGEQQRVAIARALINDPKIIFADEPTGNLDPSTAEDVFNLFLDRVQDKKTAVVMVTHNITSLSRMHKSYHLDNNLNIIKQ